MDPGRIAQSQAPEAAAYSARVFALTWPSLDLTDESQITPAASPRRIRVCFILSNLLIYQLEALYMDICYYI